MSDLRKVDFLKYVKNVVDSEFQCELKADMGEGRALVVGAIEEGTVITYSNGGMYEIASTFKLIFKTYK